jgi:hypothetical protein
MAQLITRLPRGKKYGRHLKGAAHHLIELIPNLSYARERRSTLSFLGSLVPEMVRIHDDLYEE